VLPAVPSPPFTMDTEASRKQVRRKRAACTCFSRCRPRGRAGAREPCVRGR